MPHLEKYMRRSPSLVLMLMLLFAQAFAQTARNAASAPAGAREIAIGQQYPTGSAVQMANSGVSFQLPPDWLGAMPQGAGAFVLGSNSKAGVGLVIMRGKATLQEAEALLNTPQDLGDGVVMMPDGAPVRSANTLKLNYTSGGYVGRAIAVIGKPGNGVVYFFGGPADQAAYFEGVLNQLVGSTVFFPPQSGPELQRWQELLVGTMLKRMSSYYSGGLDGAYVGGSSEESLHLCRDGSYAYSSNNNMSVDGGFSTGYNASAYSDDSRDDVGRWRVEMIGNEVNLVLESAKSGETSYHPISMNGEGHTIVDGKRAYRVPSDRCR